MAMKMIEKFDKYWTEFNLVLSIATVVDPRYKFKVLEYYLPILHGDVIAKAEMMKIKNACYELVAEYSNIYAKEDADLGCDMIVRNTVDGHCLSLEKGEVKSFEDFHASDEQSFENVGVEFDHYLEERLIPRKGDFDLFAYWKACLKYQILRLIARDIFAIPMSTVASESAFSTGGRVINESRSNLKSHKVEVLMCVQIWLHSQVKDSESIKCDDSLLWNITKDMDSLEMGNDKRGKETKAKLAK